MATDMPMWETRKSPGSASSWLIEALLPRPFGMTPKKTVWISEEERDYLVRRLCGDERRTMQASWYHPWSPEDDRLKESNCRRFRWRYRNRNPNLVPTLEAALIVGVSAEVFLRLAKRRYMLPALRGTRGIPALWRRDEVEALAKSRQAGRAKQRATSPT